MGERLENFSNLISEALDKVSITAGGWLTLMGDLVVATGRGTTVGAVDICAVRILLVDMCTGSISPTLNYTRYNKNTFFHFLVLYWISFGISNKFQSFWKRVCYSLEVSLRHGVPQLLDGVLELR